MKDMSLISLEQITKTYGADEDTYTALKGISFSINKGEFVAIMGPSGSGKSTTMHILGALDTPTSGYYFLRGKDISTYNDDELAYIRNREIGFVFQAFNLLPRTTVLRNVMLPLVYAGVSEEERIRRATDALTATGLTSTHFNHKSNQISGGQIQRVAIARALVNNPTLILADEPTGNLDTKTGEKVMHFLKDLNKKGKTIIIVTHDANLAQTYAEKIYWLKDGKVEKITKKIKGKWVNVK